MASLPPHTQVPETDHVGNVILLQRDGITLPLRGAPRLSLRLDPPLYPANAWAKNTLLQYMQHPVGPNTWGILRWY